MASRRRRAPTGKAAPGSRSLKDANGKPVVGAHPNSRFTAPLEQCPSASRRTEHHHGVPISAMIFGGRRARLAPLVYEAFDWEHGVYVGATMASERTAAQFGKQGRGPPRPDGHAALLRLQHGRLLRPLAGDGPADGGIRRGSSTSTGSAQDENGKFLWPGYGENLRVIEWILARCRGEADARETAIGYVPTPDSIDLTGLDIASEAMTKLFSVNRDDWKMEHESVATFFAQFETRLPKEMRAQHDALGSG